MCRLRRLRLRFRLRLRIPDINPPRFTEPSLLDQHGCLVFTNHHVQCVLWWVTVRRVANSPSPVCLKLCATFSALWCPTARLCVHGVSSFCISVQRMSRANGTVGRSRARIHPLPAADAARRGGISGSAPALAAGFCCRVGTGSSQPAGHYRIRTIRSAEKTIWDCLRNHVAAAPKPRLRKSQPTHKHKAQVGFWWAGSSVEQGQPMWAPSS